MLFPKSKFEDVNELANNNFLTLKFLNFNISETSEVSSFNVEFEP